MPELVVAEVAAGAATWLLTYLLHSTVVVGAVWLLVRTGRVHRPTTQDLLWKVALTAALVTASVAVFSPLRTRALDVEVRRSVAGGALGWQGGPPVGADVLRVRALAADPSPACRDALHSLRGVPGLDAPALRRACVPPAGPGWRGFLVGAWLLVGAGLLLGLRSGHRALRWSLRGAVPAAPDLCAVAREFAGPSRRAPEVVVAQDVDAPCVVAGRVVLPVRCVGNLTPDQIRAVLAHEVAHLVRRDAAWIAFGEMLCRALWLQPLNRVALAGLRGSAELVCDDWAVERTRRPMELASSIAHVAQWLGARHGRPAWGQVPQLTHLSPGDGHTLSTRVRRILNPAASRRAAPRLVRWLLAALVVTPTRALPAVPRASSTFAVFIQREGGAPPFLEGRGEDVVVLVREPPPAES